MKLKRFNTLNENDVLPKRGLSVNAETMSDKNRDEYSGAYSEYVKSESDFGEVIKVHDTQIRLGKLAKSKLLSIDKLKKDLKSIQKDVDKFFKNHSDIDQKMGEYGFNFVDMYDKEGVSISVYLKSKKKIDSSTQDVLKKTFSKYGKSIEFDQDHHSKLRFTINY